MKATDSLLADHKMVRKIMEGFTVENPRFSHILKTLHRVLLGHAWFEDTIFLPVLKAEPRFVKCFVEEFGQEHRDIDALLKLLRRTPVVKSREFEAYALQFRSLLHAHFEKEEDGLFPLAEKVLESKGLNRLGAEMKRRQAEVQNIAID